MREIEISCRRAFAVKVVPKRLPVFPFSGLLKGCKGHKTHRFENDGTNQIRKTGKREVVLVQPLPQTLYQRGFAVLPNPCHYQNYDRSMSCPALLWLRVLGRARLRPRDAPIVAVETSVLKCLHAKGDILYRGTSPMRKHPPPLGPPY